MHRTIRASALALALVLSLAPAAFAATSTSTMTATATVDATLSMTGIPSTYAFPHNVAGEDQIGPTFTITVVSSETSFTVAASSTDFTSGANTIPSNRMYANVNGTQTQFPNAGQSLAIGTTSPLTTFLKLTPAASAKSGVYTATITWTASN